jgi:hypothetical protein
MKGDEEMLVLDCYWLAHWYHQSPATFLSMPLTDVFTHVYWTKKIAELRQRSRDDDGD